MNAMTRFTAKSLRANRVRTLVTILGVALAAALLTAVLTTFTSLVSFMYQSEEVIAGSWMARASSPNRQQLQEQVDAAMDDDRITEAALLQDAGFAALSPEQQELYGPSSPLIGLTGNVEQLCGIRATEGRLPQAPGEVMLPSTWQAHGEAQLNSQLALPIGTRVAVLAPGHEDAAADASAEVGSRTIGIEGTTASQIHDGDALDSSIGYLDAAVDGGIFDEAIVDATERTFTVVGFYDRASYASSYAVGMALFTAGGPNAAGLTSAYVRMDGVSTTDEAHQRAEEAFPDADLSYHTSLLRYMGVRSNGAIWDTFFGVVSVLAGVITIACISLIYNAFAISVAERTRQFGLLSSVGASKRQLRRAVLLEALLMAAAGIPLGLAIGFGGCTATFALMGPAIATVIGDAGVPFVAVMEPWVAGIAAALTLATVLISAFIPAWRAGRTSAIEALRNVGSRRLSRKAQAHAAKNADPARIWKRSGAGRAFGAGGMLAAINAKRGAGKGTAASVSLALAIVLLMTAGSLNTFLGTLVDAASADYRYDIGIAAQWEHNPDDALAQQAQAYESAYDELCQADDAIGIGWTLYDAVEAAVPDSLAGSALRSQAAEMPDQMPSADDGSVPAFATLFLLEDDAFDQFAQQAGADPAQFHDPAHPRAIAEASIYGNDGSTYQLLTTFTGPGTIRINGVDLDIALLTDDMPTIINTYATPALIMPLSLAETDPFGIADPLFMAGFDIAEGADHRIVAEELSDIMNARFTPNNAGSIGWASISDHLEEVDNNRMLATVVNVFCLLFTGILALIAMANVFNTITNSLILRRREFAVMKSAGLSNRQFRAMIAAECARFGVKGLIPGMLVSAGVSLLLYQMVTQSISGLTFELPWAYVALSIGMTAAAMLIAVAFGMHRCRADNVVEALRMDSI